MTYRGPVPLSVVKGGRGPYGRYVRVEPGLCAGDEQVCVRVPEDPDIGPVCRATPVGKPGFWQRVLVVRILR